MNLMVTMCCHCLDDVAHVAHRLHYPYGCADSVTWLWQVVGVVVHVCHEGCGQLVAVEGVGESRLLMTTTN